MHWILAAAHGQKHFNLFDWLGSSHAEALRNWIVAIGGLIALVVALSTYVRNGKIKREEQARLVFSRLARVDFYEAGKDMPMGDSMGMSGGGVAVSPASLPGHGLWRAIVPAIRAEVVVHNGSKELIGPIKVQMVNGGTGEIWDTFSMQINSVAPESDRLFHFVWANPVHPGQPSLDTTVLFRDASGKWWRRHQAEPIERVHKDPENDAYTPTERAVWAENARQMGVEPTPEPKPSLWVKLLRQWRVIRGKRALP